MYYLFIVKNNYFDVDNNFLYDLLSKLKNMKKENYNYGISLFYNICNLFDSKTLKNYIRTKFNIKQIHNKFYLDRENYFEIRKSCCIINSKKYLKDILCIFYVYNKNIFVCNFDENEYFWISEKFNLKKKR